MSRIHPARRVWRFMRSSLWPIPLLVVALAVALGMAMPMVDGFLGTGGQQASPLAFVFGGGPSAARGLLGSIAGSLISVTGVVFSLTVVALQLGSSQYSPRLLQTFATDPVVQATLAQLTGTFIYALTVLRTVRSADESVGEASFVPRLSITLAFVFALGSVAGLVFFLGHLARSLRVETMLRNVHDEATAAIRASTDDSPGTAPVLPTTPGTPVEAVGSGFVVEVDEGLIVSAAREVDVVMALVPRIGDSVVAGTPVAHAWRRDGGAVDLGALTGPVGKAIRLSFEREPDQDAAYSLRKIVDIAGRALSPGINDPTTAVHALSHISALLGDLLPRPATAHTWCDEDGVLRLVVPRWSPEELVRLGLEEPLEYATGQPAVLRRIAGVLHEVAWRVRGRGLDATLRTLVDRAARRAAESTAIGEREAAAWRGAVDDALAGRWSPAGPVSARSSTSESPAG